MTGLPGAIPIQTSGSGSPGCIPFVASAPGTPGSLPADVASPGDPGALPIQTSGTGSPGLIPVEGIPIPIPTAGLLRGWDPNSVTGSDISTVPPGFGTTAALTTTSTVDVRSAFSPALNNMLQTTAANSEKGTFTATTALSAFTLAFIYAPSALSGTTPVPIIGNSGTTTQSYMQFNTSSGQIFRVELRPDSGTAASINLSTGQLMNLGASYLVIITYDGATVTIYINGVAVTGAKTGSFTFNQLYSTKGVFADGFWGKMALWNRVLTAPELAIVGGSTAFGTDISTGLYASDANGSNTTGFGFSSATPLKTIAAMQAKTQIITNGLAIGSFTIYGGDLNPFIGGMITPPVSGTTTNRMQYKAYSEGGDGRFKCWGCNYIVGGWTSDGGSLYTMTLAYKPNFVQLETGQTAKDVKYEKLYDKTLGTPPGATYFDYSGTTLTISVPGYFNPATTKVFIAANDANGCAIFGTTNVDIYDTDMWFWNSIIYHPSPTTGALNTYRLNASYGFNDSIDASSGASAVLNHFNWLAYQAGGIPNISGTGDICSCHGSSVVNYYNGTGAYGQSGGVRSEAHTIELVSGCVLYANAADLIRLSQGSGSGGSFTVINTTVDMTTASVTGNAYEMQLPTAGTAATTVLQFNTFYESGVSGVPNAIVIGAGTATVQDNIMDGFHGGILTTGLGAANEGNNDFHNVAFPTAGLNIVNTGPDITSDPLFVNAPSSFALQLGSPCIGAGVAISGITTDITGATRANPPTIGAYEA